MEDAFNKNGEPDPFFDPQSISLSHQEFRPVPLPDDDFEPFLQKFNDIDNMLSDALVSQDLNIATGYHGRDYFDKNGYPNTEPKKHSRRISGSAIFGFLNGHSHQLSIPGIHNSEAFKKMNEQIDYYNSNNFELLDPFNPSMETAFATKKDTPQPSGRQPSASLNDNDDFIITGKNPVGFKFPPELPKHSNQGHSNTPRQKEVSRYYSNNSPSYLNPSMLELQKPGYNSYSVDYINKLQQISRETEFPKEEDGDDSFLNSILKREGSAESSDLVREGRNNFYLLPQNVTIDKPALVLPEANLEYSSPEEFYSSPNSSPIIPHNMFISPQHNPPQLPDLQTPQKNKLPPAPKLQPANLGTPTKYTIVAKNQVDIAEKYNYEARGQALNETPKKQMISDSEQVFWTPVLITKDDPHSSKIIQEQLKRTLSPKRKETKITSTLPKGHLDQYFIGPDDDMKFTCIFQNCGKQFTRISNTRAHIQTHLSDRPFACQHCPKSFVRQHDLRRHEKSHNDFNFECPCGKKFPRQDALKRHRIRKICCGGIDDDKQLSPEKGLVSKPFKKKGRPKKEEELHQGLREKILEELTQNTKGIEYEYQNPESGSDRINGFLLNGLGKQDELSHLESDTSTVLNEFGYDSFNI